MRFISTDSFQTGRSILRRVFTELASLPSNAEEVKREEAVASTSTRHVDLSLPVEEWREARTR
jgi:hypothetical protein